MKEKWGAPISFSMKGGNVLGSIFILFLQTTSCVYHEVALPTNCSNEVATVELISLRGLADCSSNNGTIEVFALGKNPPYEYSINQIDFQSNGYFDSLVSGEYIVVARDSRKCLSHRFIDLPNYVTDLSAEFSITPDNDCESENGTIKIAARGGKQPYALKFRQVLVVKDSFWGLSPGYYDFLLSDAANCNAYYSVEIPRAATGISWQLEIKPIIDTRCAKSGCHVPGSGRKDFTVFESVKESAALIKLYTQTLRMPQDGVLSPNQINKIACWVDDGAPAN